MQQKTILIVTFCLRNISPQEYLVIGRHRIHQNYSGVPGNLPKSKFNWVGKKNIELVVFFSNNGQIFLSMHLTSQDASYFLRKYFSNSPYANKINFIKMDIEGAEFKALQGMKSILKKNQNLTILTEFAVTSLEDAGCNPDEFLKLFLDEKFEIFVIDESSMDLVPINKIDISKIKSDNETINLLCKKRT